MSAAMSLIAGLRHRFRMRFSPSYRRIHSRLLEIGEA
jgi:hypothetical protein